VSNIEEFRKIRRGGKVIAEGMTVEQIAALGPIEKTVEVRWNNLGSSVLLTSPNGIWAIVVPGRNFVAAILATDVTTRENELVVFNADGSRRFVIPSIQSINGTNMRGSFDWFEVLSTTPRDTFSVIFQADRFTRRLDIDAVDGKITGMHQAR
jgi:hypothetical protein